MSLHAETFDGLRQGIWVITDARSIREDARRKIIWLALPINYGSYSAALPSEGEHE